MSSTGVPADSSMLVGAAKVAKPKAAAVAKPRYITWVTLAKINQLKSRNTVKG